MDPGSNLSSQGVPALDMSGRERQGLLGRWKHPRVRGAAFAIGLFLAMAVFFSVSLPTTFLSAANLQSVLNNAAILLILGAGLTVILVLGEFDLSFAATIGLCGAVAVLSMATFQLPGAAAVGAAVMTGIVIGVINGVIVAYGRAPAFIGTLAMGSIITGIERWITSDRTVASGIDPAYLAFTGNRVLGLQPVTWAAFAILLIVWILLAFTTYGRKARAIGSNSTAASLAGLPVKFSRLLAFVIMGACAGFAAVLITSRGASYFPASGAGLLLLPYGAAFLGAALISRGKFGAWETLYGILFMQTLATGLTMLDKAQWMINVIEGIVLVGAVLLAMRGRRS